MMDSLRTYDRDEVKKAIFVVFFCEIHGDGELWEDEIAFRSVFPLTFETIRRLKIARGDYKYMAQLLQRTESSIIIDRVCQEIAAACPKAPLFTIHDSIMTTEPYAEYVKETIIRHASVAGLSPTVRIEGKP